MLTFILFYFINASFDQCSIFMLLHEYPTHVVYPCSPTQAGHTPSRPYEKFRRNTWIHLTRPILGFFFGARYFHITIVLTLKVPPSFPRPIVDGWSYGAIGLPFYHLPWKNWERERGSLGLANLPGQAPD
jgi:hypothetical protein